MRQRLRLPTGLPWRDALLGLCCGLASWLAATQPFGRGMEDWLQELPKPLAATGPELAEVLADLDRRGAAAVGLDVLVPDALDRYNDEDGLGGDPRSTLRPGCDTARLWRT